MLVHGRGKSMTEQWMTDFSRHMLSPSQSLAYILTWQWFEPTTHTGFCHHCSFSMRRISWKREQNELTPLEMFLLPMNCPFTSSKSFRCVFFLTTMSFWASQIFWIVLHPIMVLGEPWAPAGSNVLLGGCDKALPQMEVWWHLWEQPPGDTVARCAVQGACAVPAPAM